MLRKLADFFVRVMDRWMPDPYLFAALLTFVTYILCLIFTPTKPLAAIEIWSGSIWGLLTFTMQVSTTLVMSGALIRTKPLTAFLHWLCGFAKSPWWAYAITAFVGGLFSLLSWACGLVAGAFVAKQMAKVVKGCHYPLLVASGYGGFVIWHMGYSSSVGLLIATPGHFLEKTIGVIPVSQTIFAPYNLITAIFLLITIPILMAALAPKKEEVIELDPGIIEAEEAASKIVETYRNVPADKMEKAQIINLILGLAGVYGLFMYYAKGGSMTMDSMNLSFFVFAVVLSRTPRELIRNIAESGKSLGALVFQFPIYAGIMGLMVKTGLAAVIASWFVAISNNTTLPLWTFLSAGIVNFFVPSGGSQWAVQGPIMTEAARQMGVDVSRVSMAVAWGDQWTNMIQPFWALPMLAIAGMKAKDVMGYCTMTLIYSGIIFCLGITFL